MKHAPKQRGETMTHVTGMNHQEKPRVGRTYNLVRFFTDSRPSHIQRQLSLDDARAYGKHPVSEGVLQDGTRWFDGVLTVTRAYQPHPSREDHVAMLLRRMLGGTKGDL